MASIVLLLSELLCGEESASVLAANRYMCGQSLREFRPAATGAPSRQNDQSSDRAAAAAAGTGREEKRQTKEEESFEDLAVSRVAVDVMWP